MAAAPAFAGDVLPSNGTVTAGSASIVRTNPSTLNINQSTNQAIINWNSFSVGHGDTVNFNQPGTSSATLNRVTGTTPSWIAGTINAPGTVLLVNPNGIAITKSGTVNTGSFVGSTLDIKDSDFLAGRYKFSGNGASAGVINNGHINVSDGGFAALLGGQVSNNGVIAARLGKVGLGAGEQATLDLSGDGFLSVAVPSSELGHMTRADGALVSNKGKINADGGTVFLSAATASNILRNAVNMGGTIRANSVGMHDGRIVINGGGGNVNVTGKLLAKSKTGKGGEVDITSASAGVKLVGALIDVSGKTGGGVVNIGGGPHATVLLANAQSVSLDTTTVIKADATDGGDGGHIVIWSNGQTIALGDLSARGGPNGGNGGLVETSGASVNFNGITVNASAAKGTAGTWLVDPTDLTIDSAASSTILAALQSGTNVTLQTNIDGTTSGPGNLSSGNGDININAAIADYNINQDATLTLQATNNINVNQLIFGTGGIKVSMQAGGSVNVGADILVSGLTIVSQNNINVSSAVGDFGASATNLTAAGNINIATANGHNELGSNPTLTAGGSIAINGGTSIGGITLSAYNNVAISGSLSNTGGGTVTLNADSMGGSSGTVSFTNGAQLAAGGADVSILYHPGSYTSPTSYSGSVTGQNSLTAYMLVNNVTDLEAINSNLGGTYALATDISASSGTFTPIGYSPNSSFSGLFDGRNHLVSNLSTSLFYENTGAIRNVGVAGTISADTSSTQLGGVVGGLVDTNFGTISNSFSTMTINATQGGFAVGGLVGENNGGTITNSYATGNVSSRDTGSNFDDGVGGLVGINAGTIQYSYATGNVSGGIDTGGLVGWNNTSWTDRNGNNHFVDPLINYTYALGSVTGYNVGGLVGKNNFSATGASQNGEIYGIIENSYAAGHVSCTGPNCVYGGLVGWLGYTGSGTATGNFNDLSAKVFWSIWNADSTGTTKPFGTTYQDAYKCAGQPSCSTNQVQFIGFVSANSGLTSDSGAANLGNPYLASSYTTPQNGIFNDPTPGNTSNLQGCFSCNWYLVDGSTMPILRSEYSTTIQNAHQLELTNLNTSATYTLARDITYRNDGLWTSAGFSPIASFNGTFNGNGNTISGLTVTASNLQNVGLLFNVLAPGGVVENLGLVNGSLNVNNSGFNFTDPNTSSIGALVGWNVGSIVNVWATGTTVSTYGARYVGGLVGANGGSIDQSWTSATVSGVYQKNWSDYTFVDNEGGLVGYNNGTITNSYALGGVSGNGNVGGLVGFNDGGRISNTYTTAQVFREYVGYGIQAAGPLVGYNNGQVYSSYWDSTVASPDSRGSGNAGTGLTTAQMQDINSFETNYSGWDFQRIWVPPSSGYYPELYGSSYVAVIWPGSQSMTYGSSVPTLTASVFGLRSYDPTSTISISSITTSATSSSNAGTYAINTTSNYPYISINGVVPNQVATDTGFVPPAVNPQGYGFGSGNCGGYICSITINGVTIDPYSYRGNFDMTAGGAATMFNYYLSSVGIQTTVNNGRLVLLSGGPITISGPDPSSYGLTAGTIAAVANAPVSHDGTAYRILNVPGTLTINPVMLTGSVSINDINKVYNGTNVASGGSVTLTSSTAGVTGITGNGSVTLAVSTGTYSQGANVDGNELINIIKLSASNPNYNLSGLTVTANGAITPETLTITPNSGQSKVYGNNDPTLAYTIGGTLYNGYTLSGALSRYEYGQLIGENVGSYAINQGTLSANSNYSLSFTTGVQFAINEAALTITPNSGQSKIYGNNDPTLTYQQTGLVQNKTIDGGVQINDSLSGALSRAQYGSVQGENVGSYAITRGSLSASSNYALTFAPNVQFAINQASLTITPDGGQFKTYGTNDPTLTYQQSGLVQNVMVDGVLINDSISGALSRAQYGSQAGENVGHYAIIQGTLGASSNYALTFTPNVQFAINQASLTVTPDSGQSKIYGTNDPTLTYQQTGLVQNVMVDGVLLNDTLTGSLSRAQYGSVPGENVGSYAITQGSLAASSNYALTFTPNVQFAINQASLTITPDSGQSKIYGNNDPTLTYQQTGLVQNVMVDGVLLNDSLSGALSRAQYGSVAGENVGSYATTQGSLAASSNYALTFTPNVQFAINQASLTITANNAVKTYGDVFNAFTYGQTGLVSGVKVDGVTLNDSIGSVTMASPGSAAMANVAGSPYTITVSNAVGSGLGNYKIAYVDGLLTVNPAQIVVTALGGGSIYGQSPLNPGLAATGLKNAQDVSVLTGLVNSFGVTNLTNAGTYTLNVAGKLTNPNYVVTTLNSGSWTVTPATLTYVADPSTQFAGSTFPAFTGTVIGFVNGQNLASGTTGTAVFDTPATPSSTPGTYGIFGSGLTANHNNYVFVQAPGNATALKLNPQNGTTPSQVPPPAPPAQPPVVGINFQNPNTGANLSRVSFTPSSQPGINTASNQPGNNNDVNTASLTAGDKYMHNHGLYFPPISQYDSEQYSDFKLPKFAPSDSQATVLTILARGIAQAKTAKYMIDGFWNGDGSTTPGEGNTWPGPGNIDLLDKATFSDGAGHNATPTNDPAFPIAAGKTDFAALLNNGPVMIGASPDRRPVQWLLATAMAPDGKGIICDDTMTGKLVELSYDPATRTVGGITKLFDDKSKSFVPLADASNDIPASDASGLSGLQTFVPSTYFAVTVN